MQMTYIILDKTEPNQELLGQPSGYWSAMYQHDLGYITQPPWPFVTHTWFQYYPRSLPVLTFYQKPQVT